MFRDKMDFEWKLFSFTMFGNVKSFVANSIIPPHPFALLKLNEITFLIFRKFEINHINPGKPWKRQPEKEIKTNLKFLIGKALIWCCVDGWMHWKDSENTIWIVYCSLLKIYKLCEPFDEQLSAFEMGDLQATVEFSLEFYKFYNVDLFQRG